MGAPDPSYQKAVQDLYGLHFFGTKLGLESARHLAHLAGDPQRQLRFIHVAGTNGKGSTCAMLESIYRAAGYRVGLFTSPHLVSFRERIQVQRELISEEAVVRLVAQVQRGLKASPGPQHPTFFEVVTVMALRYFAEQHCDLVIWETGLGGRLDATNIVAPLAAVITTIQLDHEKWLGSTLPSIAAEKAGILKPGVPALTAVEDADAFAVISATAARIHAPLTRVTRADLERPPLRALQLPLLGEHQRLNAALAVATVQTLLQTIPVSEAALRQGLESVRWPGRLQVVPRGSGHLLVLDGAHNPAGAETLRDSLQQQFAGRKTTLVLGVLRDKDWSAMCRILAPFAHRMVLTPVQSERTALPDELRHACASANPDLEISLTQSLADALSLTREDPFVVVTGSLHLVGEAMEQLGLLPSSANERTLNEWNAAAVGVPNPTGIAP
jgi:dihydrofolate synthase/folylpolyglutamate synthase